MPLRLHRRAIVLRVEHDQGSSDVALALPLGRRASLPTTPEQVLCGLRALLGAC